LIPHSRRNAMSGKYTAVFGIYPAHVDVKRGVGALRLAGFRNSDISVPYPKTTDSRDLAQERSNEVQDGASVGGGIGALVGGAVGWLVGTVALALPGVGHFTAAGSILAALVGAGVGGVVGEIAGALIGISMPEDGAKRHENQAMRSGIPLFVHPHNSEWAMRAKEILEQTGAQNVSFTGDTHPTPASDRLVVREVVREVA
jgi:hypothetical protein